MKNLIRKYLLKMVNDLDAGNTNITEDDAIKIASTLREYNNKDIRLSKYQAYMYLNVSRATFDNYVRAGKLPKGRHEAGFKELSWSKKDLDDFIKSRSHDNTKKNKYTDI